MSYPILPLNLQQLWQDQSDRITRLELAYNGPQVSADAAQTTGNTALTDAATALANAAIAYTTAENSLQPSAYAIQDPTTKQLTSINATGLTVYVNSPTTGARVVLNSVGLAGYNSSGVATFAITASTGAAVFSGSITGSTITGSTLNISGNFIVNSSGLMTCTGATVTGTITTSALTATGGTVGGWTISSTALSDAAGTTFFNSSTGALTTHGQIFSFGSYGGSGGFSVDTSGNLQSYTVQTALGGFINAGGHLINSGYATTTNAANVYMNSGSGLIALVTSSQRYKVEILPETIPLDSVMSLIPKSWIDKGEYEANENSSNGLKRVLGVIAEDVAQIPVLKDLLVNYNEQGQPDSINYDRIAVTLIPLLQDLQNRVTKLEGK